MDRSARSVATYLFGDEQLNAFAVLDGASVSGLLEVLHRLAPEHECLFRGDLEPDMLEVAPYLVSLKPDSEFTEWILQQGWGKHWGIFALGQSDLRAMRQHFRKFLIVYDAEGNPRRFRYYDPRVLRVHLPKCTPAEAAAMFGPVEAYLMESENPRAVLRFRHLNGSLKQEQLTLD